MWVHCVNIMRGRFMSVPEDASVHGRHHDEAGTKPLPVTCLFASVGAFIGFMAGSLAFAWGLKIGGFMAGFTTWAGPVVLFAIAFIVTLLAINICVPCQPICRRRSTFTSSMPGVDESDAASLPAFAAERLLVDSNCDYRGYDNVVCFLSLLTAAATVLGWVIGALVANFNSALIIFLTAGILAAWPLGVWCCIVLAGDE